MSNILAMPLVRLIVEASNNEDWVDCLEFLVDTGDPILPQLDLRGIDFDMEIRRSATDSEVIVAASTANNTIQVGTPPDFGFLIINIPIADMQNITAGEYVGDIVGHDAFYRRVIATITLTIIEGVTKQPVNKRIVVEATL
jgi:hypothetical protein